MTETAGITPAADGLFGIQWNILGQVYVPKQVTEDSFAWHATFPSETFVPPHIHPLQDEYVYLLEGSLDLWLDGERRHARAGDLVRMPRGIPHGLYNNTGDPVRCWFWVSPTGRLFDMFKRIHNVATPAEVVRLSAEYDVHFLPPRAA
jgi:mannose-6-phosphate isomerase-like protein (cupin superfamily)